MDDRLYLLWAKSDAGGRPHSLPGHLLDSLAVAELIWDEFLAPGLKSSLDDVTANHGRDLLRLLCGWHDVGKATPAFQTKMSELSQRASMGGVPIPTAPLGSRPKQWHHTHAGRAIVEDYLSEVGAPEGLWIGVVVEGHHGRFRGMRLSREGHGSGRWEAIQRELCAWVLRAAEIDLSELNLQPPPRALQLALAGLVVMADWIASSDLFGGMDTEHVTLAQTRQRARRAWDALGIRGGSLGRGALVTDDDFVARFGFTPRPLQYSLLKAAGEMARPGLIIVEAPMGEGKTEAGFGAAEALAGKFGLDGMLVAMPTQGTTDAMYARCHRWLTSVAEDFPLALVHGKAMMNEEWRQRCEVRDLSDVYDDDDSYGLADQISVARHGAPADWLVGRHRALLAPGVVCTVDHLLYAGTRTKFVMLRHAGLAGKVVIIDEVHCYDVFMASFLHEVLSWLGELKVPVILMSATLPPAARAELLEAYHGASLLRESSPAAGYPSVTIAEGAVRRIASAPWRDSKPMAVELLGGPIDDLSLIADRISEDLAEGGCALAILNTVRRAQELARQLRERGEEVLLLHGRLTTKTRADRTAQAIALLGPGRGRGAGRPMRLVVVATQVAEQSFDVDADVLYTDVAPMDLVLQRMGRLHRHDRPSEDRPVRLRRPQVIVTGLTVQASGCEFPGAFDYVYEPWALLRAAAILSRRPVLSIPEEVPALVAEAYAAESAVPTGWRESEQAARNEADANAERRRSHATSYRLGYEQGKNATDLAELHGTTVANSGDEVAVVRDGEPTLEVVLVVDGERGFETVDGRPLGPTGERCSDIKVARDVLGDAVRVRQTAEFVALRPLPGWAGAPFLRTQPALILTRQLTAELPSCTVAYDAEYGLVIDWKGPSR